MARKERREPVSMSRRLACFSRLLSSRLSLPLFLSSASSLFSPSFLIRKDVAVSSLSLSPQSPLLRSASSRKSSLAHLAASHKLSLSCVSCSHYALQRKRGAREKILISPHVPVPVPVPLPSLASSLIQPVCLTLAPIVSYCVFAHKLHHL